MGKRKKKDINMGSYVAGSIVTGTVAGSLATTTGSTTGSTMSANLMTGAARPIVPVMKVKGAGMVLKSVGTLKKPMRKLMKKQTRKRMFYKKKDEEGYGFF